MDVEGLSEPTEKGSENADTSVVSVKTGCCSFNPVSGSGKRWHQSQMLLLPFVPIAALIAQNCWSMFNIIVYQGEMKELRRQVRWACVCWSMLNIIFYPEAIKKLRREVRRKWVRNCVSIMPLWQIYKYIAVQSCLLNVNLSLSLSLLCLLFAQVTSKPDKQ